MLKKFSQWLWLFKEPIGFPLAWREARKECRKLRRQRDCLYKHFLAPIDMYFTLEPLPKDLLEVLDEIEGGDGPSSKAQ